MCSEVARTADARREIASAEWIQMRWGWLESVRRDTSISATARLVAHALALDFAHHRTARCDPGNGAIRDVVGVSEPTVKRALAELVAAGWIARTTRRGRGLMATITFLTRARIVPLKGVVVAPFSTPEKGSLVRGFRGSEKGSDLIGKGVKNDPPYNNDKPYMNHRAREAALDGVAQMWAKAVRDGSHIPPSGISNGMAERMIAQGLVTLDDLRAAGVDA